MKKQQSTRRWGALYGILALLPLSVAPDIRAQATTGEDKKTTTTTDAGGKKLAAVAKVKRGVDVSKASAVAQRDPNAMTLTDIQGRNINVILLGANGDMLKIRRETDDQEFEIQLAQLDALSQRRVENWKERTPEAMDYSLKFKAEKRLVDSTDFEYAGRQLETSQWVYDVVITNETRNVLKDATLEYRIIYDDEVNFVRTSISPGEGAKRQEGDGVGLPEMGFNARAEFSTARMDLQTYQYTPSRGAKEFERDRLVGIWIRVMKRGEILAEFKSNETTMSDLVWDDEDETEIVIRDSFKEQFESRDPETMDELEKNTDRATER